MWDRYVSISKKVQKRRYGDVMRRQEYVGKNAVVLDAPDKRRKGFQSGGDTKVGKVRMNLFRCG